MGSGMGGMGGGMGGGMASMIAGIVQGVTGIGQMIAGGVKSAKAKQLMPPETDPTQVSMVSTLRNLRMGYGTGSEAATYKNVINSGVKSAMNKAAAYSGGNTGQLLASFGNAIEGADNAYNNIASALEKNRMGALALEKQATDEVAQRRLDIKMAKYLQAMGEATTLGKAGMQNFAASFNTFSGGTTQGDMTGGGDPTGGVNQSSVKRQPAANTAPVQTSSNSNDMHYNWNMDNPASQRFTAPAG